MDDQFKIYIEQLRDGHEEKIKETLAPDFLDVGDPDLVFKSNVQLEGSAYLADSELVLHWDIQAEAWIPCSICNEPVKVPLHIFNFYYSEPLSEIKTGIYNFKDLLRETLLLEVPSFAECEQSCPKRKEYSKFLKEASNQSPDQEEGYRPFADWKP